MTIATQPLDLKKIAIAPIQDRQAVKKFVCGERSIDRWVSEKAHKHHCEDRSRVFCAMNRGSVVACGFYALSFSPINSALLFNQDASRYKEGVAPFVYIDWLAVQRPVQGRGIGTLLLMHALSQAYAVSKIVAIYDVALRPLNERVRNKYERHGFVVREESQHPLMILPIWTLRDLFGGK